MLLAIVSVVIGGRDGTLGAGVNARDITAAPFPAPIPTPAAANAACTVSMGSMEMPKVTIVISPLVGVGVEVESPFMPVEESSSISSWSFVGRFLTRNMALGFSFVRAPRSWKGLEGESWMYTVAAVERGRELLGRRKMTMWLRARVGEVGRVKVNWVGETAVRSVWTV